MRVEIADRGIFVDFPDTMSESEIQSVLKREFGDESKPSLASEISQGLTSGFEKTGKTILGIGEAVGSLGSQAIGAVASIPVGLRNLISGGAEQARSEEERVRSALSYEPQTPEGKSALATLSTPFEYLGRGIKAAAEFGAEALSYPQSGAPIVTPGLPPKGEKSPEVEYLLEKGLEVGSMFAPIPGVKKISEAQKVGKIGEKELRVSPAEIKLEPIIPDISEMFPQTPKMLVEKAGEGIVDPNFVIQPKKTTVIERPFVAGKPTEADIYIGVGDKNVKVEWNSKNKKYETVSNIVPEKDVVPKEVPEVSVEGKVVAKELPRVEKESGQVEIPRIKGFSRTIAEFFDPVIHLPGKEKYLQERYKSFGWADRVETMADHVFERLKKLEPNEQYGIFQYLDGSIPLDSLPDRQVGNSSIRAMAQTLRTTNNLVGKMLVDRGILSPEQYAAHKDAYVRYLYLRHVLPDETVKVNPTGKLDLSYIKSRKDMTPEQRRALGLIEDVSVAEPYGLSTTLTDIGKHDFMRNIASNSEWSWQPSFVEYGKRRMSMGELVDEVKIANEMVKQAPNVPEIRQRHAELKSLLDEASAMSGHVPENFVQLPNTSPYGPLRGAFVRKEIARDLMPVFGRFSQEAVGSKALNFLLNIEEKGMAAFKVSKTALNPPTAFRNTISNIVQLNMSGIPIYDIPGYIIKAAESMLKKDEVFTQGKRNGLFRTNWGASEIKEILNTVRTTKQSSLPDVLGGLGRLAKYYGKIDDFFKLAKLHEQVGRGVEIGQAIIEAQKWGMDYSLANPAVKVARRHVMPFLSYGYKIAPLIIESMAKRPWVIAKYAALPYLVFPEVFKQVQGITEDQYQKLRKNLPEFIKKSESYAVLPWKSPEGNWQWVNLEYFFPWQQFSSIARDMYNKEHWEAVKDFGFGNPFMQIASTVWSGSRDNPPRDPFTQRDIYHRIDSPADKMLKTVEWLYGLWAPSAFTRYGASGYTATVGEKDKYGRMITSGQAVGRWFGLNIVAPTAKQKFIERKAREKQLESEWYKVLKDPTIKMDKKREIYKNYLNKRQEVVME